MKKILIGIMLLFIACALNAQTTDTTRKLNVEKWKQLYGCPEEYLVDTFKLTLNGIQIEMAARGLDILRREELQFNFLIKDFQDYYCERKDAFPSMSHYKLEYYPQNLVLTKELLDTSSVEYFCRNDIAGARKKNFINECIIHAPRLAIHLFFSNDSLLLDTNLQSKVNKYVELQSFNEWSKTKNAYASIYIDSVAKIPYREKSDSWYRLHLSTGLTSSKSAAILSAEIKAGYVWNNYGSDIGYYLSYDWNFSFAENGTRSINSFINLSALEEGFLPRIKTMAGIDMGYLVFRQGDVFEKNTFRLGFGFKGDFWYFSPQMYFPGKFKGVYPGLRVLIGI